MSKQCVFMGIDRAHHVWKAVMVRLIEEKHFIQSVAIDDSGNGLIVVNPTPGGISEDTLDWVVDKLMGRGLGG